MNLTKLFETQAKLDKKIVEEKGLEGQDLLDKKILALQVELGELCNCWRGFKFWSEDRKPRTNDDKWYVVGKTIRHYQDTYHSYHYATVIQKDRNPLLEEYVDCLHFILSIGLELGIKEHKALPHKQETITDQFIELNYQTYLVLQRNENNKGSHKGQWYLLMDMFIGLGEMLGFTWKEVEQAYYAKNKENHERQENGY